MNRQGVENQDETVAQQWVEELKSHGYEHHIANRRDCRRLKLTRVWRRIFRAIKVDRSARLRILEVGCGGGIHLARLAAQGHECTGIDVSREVLARAANYFTEIRNVCGLELRIRLVPGDFFAMSAGDVGGSFDLVFNSGVVEHFLDDETRLRFLEKKYELTRPGGYIVSYVPSGCHPLRGKMRTENLGGYNIPEIDYDCSRMAQEFQALGAGEIVVLPHNLFGYLLFETDNVFFRTLKKLIYLGLQLIPPTFFPANFSRRQAGNLIGIARKPKLN